MSRSLKAHILLVIVTFVWGSTFVLIKNAVAQDASPLLFNFARMALAMVALAIIFWRDLKNIHRASFRAGALVGTFLWLGYEFQTTGLQLTTASKSAFLTGVSVILVPVFLALFWQRKVSQWTAVGVALAFTGLFLLTVPASESGMANFASVNFGDLLTLGCAVSFAFHIIFLGKATERYPVGQIAFLQIATAVLWMGLSLPLAREAQHIHFSSTVVWALVITALLGTAAAFSIQAWAQQFTPPAHTALIFSLEPVFAWITSYVVLGERLGGRGALGALLILAGVLTSELLGSVAQPETT